MNRLSFISFIVFLLSISCKNEKQVESSTDLLAIENGLLPAIQVNGEGNTAKIVVDTIPGSIWRYSGGGYTFMEKVVEDISGLPLEVYMKENILQAIGMYHSTYEQPQGEDAFANASVAYDYQGEIIEGLWHNYPEQAAAGLWTTPSDLAKYCMEIQEILKGKMGAVLSMESVEEMLTKHKNDWGLGPSLKWMRIH